MLRRNSDESIRKLAREAYAGDLLAARRLVIALERSHGVRRPFAIPPTLEEVAASTVDVVLNGGGREFTDEQFEAWRRGEHEPDVSGAIRATVAVATTLAAQNWSRFIAEMVASEIDLNPSEETVEGIAGTLASRCMEDLLHDDMFGWETKLERRVREILRAEHKTRENPPRKQRFVVRSIRQGLDLIRHPAITKNFAKALRWRPKNRIAVLVPCAGTKPFPEAPSHRDGYLAALKGKKTDLWVVSEPLGVVPYEWSRTWPNNAYDYPPKYLRDAAWDALAERVAEWLRKVAPKYEKVFVALPGHHERLLRAALEIHNPGNLRNVTHTQCLSSRACPSGHGRATSRKYRRYLSAVVKNPGRVARNPRGELVYHGTDEPELEELHAGTPPYAGGLGHGVYVSRNWETARFYGRHVYAARLLLDDEQILDLSPENWWPIEGLEGHSILVGEQVQPFGFRIGDKTYSVTGSDDEWESMAVAGRIERAVEEIQRGWIDAHGPYEQLGDGLLDLLLVKARDGRLSSDPEEWEEDVVETLQASGDLVDADFEGDGFDVLPGPKAAKVDPITKLLAGIVDKTEDEVRAYLGESIDLDEIARVAGEHGYKAVYVEGIRSGASVNDELLVFDPNDLEFVGMDDGEDRPARGSP